MSYQLQKAELYPYSICCLVENINLYDWSCQSWLKHHSDKWWIKPQYFWPLLNRFKNKVTPVEPCVAARCVMVEWVPTLTYSMVGSMLLLRSLGKRDRVLLSEHISTGCCWSHPLPPCAVLCLQSCCYYPGCWLRFYLLSDRSGKLRHHPPPPTCLPNQPPHKSQPHVPFFWPQWQIHRGVRNSHMSPFSVTLDEKKGFKLSLSLAGLVLPKFSEPPQDVHNGFWEEISSNGWEEFISNPWGRDDAPLGFC